MNALARALELARELKSRYPWRPFPGPQTMAYESQADITGYGGSAGGGKTDLLAGLALTRHKRVLIVRREKAQTEGVIQRLTEIVGNTNGFNSQKAIWRLPIGKGALVEFAGLDNPGDERRWQGRAHDAKFFDEATEMREAQVRFIMGWNRTSDSSVKPRVIMTFNPPVSAEGRWVIGFFAPWLDKKHPNPALPGELRWYTTVAGKDFELPDSRPLILVDDKPVYDFDPKDYPPEKIIRPKSRTFIPARLTDNPVYMKSGYMDQLQALPEPLRSQLLNGDFAAGIEDDIWQVIPTLWVEIAQARWQAKDVKPPMDSMGVDVARGGKDSTDIARRHGWWFDEAVSFQGEATNDGPKVAGQVVSLLRDNAVVHLDVIGVGASPYDFLNQINGVQVVGVNVSNTGNWTDKSGLLSFPNMRSWLWWRMRELLDPNANNGIALPPDPKLLADLCAPKWTSKGRHIVVESREEIVKRIQRSPDRGTAYILASMDTPKRAWVEVVNAHRDYDPLATPDRSLNRQPHDYNPLDVRN